MKLKLEKLLTAGFAAALGASFIAANPAEASVTVYPDTRTTIEINDGINKRFYKSEKWGNRSIPGYKHTCQSNSRARQKCKGRAKCN